MKTNSTTFAVVAFIVIMVAVVLLFGCTSSTDPLRDLAAVQQAFPTGKVYLSGDDPLAYAVVDKDHVFYVEAFHGKLVQVVIFTPTVPVIVIK